LGDFFSTLKKGKKEKEKKALRLLINDFWGKICSNSPYFEE
jgi:hypothetical protein